MKYDLVLVVTFFLLGLFFLALLMLPKNIFLSVDIYQSALGDNFELIIEFKNMNLPNLLNLSKIYHLNLSTYNPSEVLKKIKGEWTLEYLTSADE